MKIHAIFRTFLYALGVVLASVQYAPGAEPDAARPLELRRIMNELSRNMQLVTDAIAREDWALVEKTAPLIGRHPQPPAPEKARILAFVGSNVGRFKAHDEKTHEAAHALGEAAGRKDAQGAIAAFQALQTGCYNCHRDFRAAFVEHFYGKR